MSLMIPNPQCVGREEYFIFSAQETALSQEIFFIVLHHKEKDYDLFRFIEVKKYTLQ